MEFTTKIMITTTVPITVPTYPARPVNGGPFPSAREKTGRWIYEPKYNGWRALVHVESGTMFNRKGERLSINGEFRDALDALREKLNAGRWYYCFKWVDVEALERRHGIGQGCLIVLDAVPERAFASVSYLERRLWFCRAAIPEINVAPPWTGLNPPQSDFPLLSTTPQISGDLAAWSYLQSLNHRVFGCQFYEGFVAKRADSVYPIQLRGPEESFPFWVKHRWRF